jgi:hypothetical protein
MMARFLAIVLTSVVFTGCAVGPNYRRPVVKALASFVEAPRQNVAKDTAALAEWWTGF